LLNFLKTKRYAKKHEVYKPAKSFEKIWKIEWWLHVVNPWLLITSIMLLLISVSCGSLVALIILGIGLMFLTLKTYRAWILQQLYLVIAAVRNLWTKETLWSK
jgi:hypothetical protein